MRNSTTVLDVGAGSGAIPWYMGQKYGVEPRGVDILAPSDNRFAAYASTNRDATNASQRHEQNARMRQDFMNVSVFNGSALPFPDASYDIVTLISVLHHAANNTPSLVADSMRVAREYVVIFEDLELPPTSPYHFNVSTRNRQHEPKGIFRTLDEWYTLFNATRGVGDVRHGFLCEHFPVKRPCSSFGVPHKLFYVAFVLAVEGRCRRDCGGLGSHMR